MNQPALSECQKTSSVYQSNNEKIKQQMQELSLSQFKAMIDQYVLTLTRQMEKAEWFEGKTPAKQFIAPDLTSYQVAGQHDASSLFTPFIQKLVIKPGSKVVIVGDLHGDLDALLALLQELEETGYLDSQYRLIREDVYFVFLGDYVNRGLCSIGVIYLLCKLYINNPEHVVLLRGNHEYALTSKKFHERFMQTIDGHSDVPVQKTLLCELSEQFEDYHYPDLLYWFDYLPMALYLGTPDQKGFINFVKFCHAGLEVGYNPKDFLSSNAAFCLLTKFDRHTALARLKQELVDSSFADDVQKSFDYCNSSALSDFEKYFITQESIDLLTDISPYHARIGMQWNNFLTHNDGQPEFALSLPRRTLYLGKCATQYLLKQRSNDRVAVRGVMRGHQHLDEKIDVLAVNSPMLTLIRNRDGVVKQWAGMVYTLGAAHKITGCHSFVMLHTDHDLSKWSLRHYSKKPEQDLFVIRMSPMFGDE